MLKPSEPWQETCLVLLLLLSKVHFEKGLHMIPCPQQETLQMESC